MTLAAALPLVSLLWITPPAVASDMHRSYENLRHCHVPIRPLNHFVPALPIVADVDLAIAYAVPLQQSLGGRAKRAITGRVNLD